MLQVIAIALIAAAPLPTVRLTTLKEAEITGLLERWDDRSITIGGTIGGDSGAGSTYELVDLLRVEIGADTKSPSQNNFAPSPNPSIESGEGGFAIGSKVAKTDERMAIELVDGSLFSGDNFLAAGARAAVQGGLGQPDDDPPLEFDLTSVRSVRLQAFASDPPSEADPFEAQWREIRSTAATGDLIVIRKPGADRLNYVEGAIGEVSERSVQFTLADQTVEVNRDKVFGLIFYRTADNNRAPPAVLVEGPGVRLAARRVHWEADKLVVETSLLGEVRLSPTAARVVDYSRGRVAYLSDLEPIRSDWTFPPGLMCPPGMTWGDSLLEPLARDRGFYSQHLELEFPAASLPPEQATSAGIPRRMTYKKGLAVRSRMELAYRIPRGFHWFRATAGIDPRTRETGEVELRILADGDELARLTLRGGETPVELECDISGRRELLLVVDFAADGTLDAGTGDNLHLANARITK